MCEVRIGRVRVFGASVEEVGAGLVDDGNMHVAGVSRKTLTRLCHKAGGDSVFGTEGLDDVSIMLISIAACSRRPALEWDILT